MKPPRSPVALATGLCVALAWWGPSPLRAQEGPDDGPAIESISVDYPHGETRLVVWTSGEAALYYGALPRRRIVAEGIFTVESLHERLRPKLHPVAPREAWPDPKAEAGMVQIRFEDGTEQVHLIFDERAFAERLFEKARENVVGGDPLNGRERSSSKTSGNLCTHDRKEDR